MKKIVALTVSAAALALSAPAMAATVNIALVGVGSENIQNEAVGQAAGAVNVNIGEQVDALIDQTVTNVNNLISSTVDIDQSATGGFSGNGAAAVVVASNTSSATVGQIGLAVNGAGDLRNTDVTQAVTNLNNAIVTEVNVTQD